MRVLLRALAAMLLFGPWGWVEPAQALSFSIDGISPEIVTGLGSAPDEIYVEPGPGPLPALPPAPVLIPGGSPTELDALSFGRHPSFFHPRTPALFSVDRGTSAVAGSALAVEFGAGLSEQPSDVFGSSYTGTNSLYSDGDGLAIGTNPAVPPLAVAEPASFVPPGPPPPTLNGDVDGIDDRGTVLSGGSPTGVVFFSLSSATAGAFSGADVLLGPGVYAASGLLGLLPSDDIDALVVFDDGDGIFLPGTDIVLFSLAPGSPGVGAPDPVSGVLINEGDILIDDASAVAFLGSPGGAPAILHPAESLGLFTTRSGAGSDGNLNALDIVPEPASGGLLGLGVAGLAWLRRRAGQRTLGAA